MHIIAKIVFFILFILLSQPTFCQQDLKKIVSVLSSNGETSSSKEVVDSIRQSFLISQFLHADLKPLLDNKIKSKFYLTSQWTEGNCIVFNKGIPTIYKLGQDFFFSNWSQPDTIFSKITFIGFGENLSALSSRSLNRVIKNRSVVAYNSIRGYDSITTQWIVSNKLNSPYRLEKYGVSAVLAVLPEGYYITHPNYSTILNRGKEIIYMFISQEMFKEIVAISKIKKSERRISKRKYFHVCKIRKKEIEICSQTKQKIDSLCNIVGVKKGNTENTILIGAHYDRVTSNSPKQFYLPGANDNSSGVAILLALANKFKNLEVNNSIIYIAFDGEEKGLYGSKNFIDTYPYDKTKIKTMINLDMLGNLKGDSLFYSVTMNEGIMKILTSTNLKCSKKLHIVNSNLGLSDSYTFSSHNIPTIYLSTGNDSNQHTIKDTEDRINYSGMEKILGFIVKLILEIDQKEN